MIETPLLRIDKDKAISLVINLAPEYSKILEDFQGPGGWLKLPKKFLNMRTKLNIENYPELYNDERAPGTALFMAILGKDEFLAWTREVNSLPMEQQKAVLDEFISEFDQLDISDYCPPDTEEADQQALVEFNQLPQAEQKEITCKSQFFWGYVFAQFYNTLSVMIHGERLTSLVAKARAGDQLAFCKAIQIDRTILTHHPYFSERHQRAAENGEEEFLAKIAYRERNPTLKGKIRYPALYMVFSLLESLSWLDDLTHQEILDICDRANLDRFQNRIEDVNYVTKRLREYRRFQKSGGVSMHSN